MGFDQYVLRSLDDWRFFYQCAESAMGIGAINYEYMLGGGGHSHNGSFTPSRPQLLAAERHARIEHRLAALCSADLRLVRLICRDRPREQWSPFGAGGIGNLATESKRAARALEASRSTRALPSWLDRLGARLMGGRATAEEHGLKGKIVEELESIVTGVHERYEARQRKSA